MPINDNQQDKQYYITDPITKEPIPVTEDIYRAYNQPLWAEHKRHERAKRCRISDGKGKLKRCTGDCSKCTQDRSGSDLSLDQFREDGFEPSSGGGGMDELLIHAELLSELLVALEELDPDGRRITDLLLAGLTEREIATQLGIRQSTLNYRKQKLFARLRERLKNFY